MAEGSCSEGNCALYQALDIAPWASFTDIKRAFHKKAKVLSPDRHLGHPEWKAVNEKFAYLVFAHNVLKCPTSRNAYDSAGFQGLRRVGVVIPAGFANFDDPLPEINHKNNKAEENRMKLERMRNKLAREMKMLEDYWARRMAERLRLQEETREAFRIATYKQIVQIAWKKEILNERKNFLSARHGF